MGLHNVFMQCRLFDALARPVLNYGCELWGPYAMMRARVARGMDSEVELWHRAILRQMLGVRKSVPIAVLMHEVNRTPIHLSWLKQSLRFWNKVCCRPTQLVSMAMQESLDMGARTRSGWVHTLNMALAKQGLDRVTSMTEVDVDAVMKMATQKWKDRVWGRIPQHGDMPVRAVGDADRGGFKLYAYSRWFMHDPWQVGKAFTSHLFERDRIRAVARMRMGVHWLNADRLRSLPRSQRVCKCCKLHVREDELHLLECPGYEDLRRRYGMVTITNPLGDGNIWAAMNSDSNFPFWNRFAGFIMACWKRRDDVFHILDSYLT